MTYVSAAAFGAHGVAVAGIGEAYVSMTPVLGRDAALLFGLALLASGLSSSIVGTAAGQAIMQDLVTWSIPNQVRRCVTMLPSAAVALAGIDVTHALVGTQIVLSLLLPLPLVALVYFTSRRSTMGRFANGPVVIATAACATAFVVAMNALLLFAVR
jgi:manganese transport protein